PPRARVGPSGNAALRRRPGLWLDPRPQAPVPGCGARAAPPHPAGSRHSCHADRTIFLRMILALLLVAAVPTLELAVERGGAPDAALVVRVHNPAGHRPMGLLREFWKFESIQCTLTRDGTLVPYKLALKPDRPTLAQLVILASNSEYGERLPLSDVWGTVQ